MKLKMSLGDVKFEAEGDTPTVCALFGHYLAVVKRVLDEADGIDTGDRVDAIARGQVH